MRFKDRFEQYRDFETAAPQPQLRIVTLHLSFSERAAVAYQEQLRQLALNSGWGVELFRGSATRLSRRRLLKNSQAARLQKNFPTTESKPPSNVRNDHEGNFSSRTFQEGIHTEGYVDSQASWTADLQTAASPYWGEDENDSEIR